VGRAIRCALLHEGTSTQPRPEAAGDAGHLGDPVYAVLRSRRGFLTAAQIAAAAAADPAHAARSAPGAREVLRRIRDLSHDFEVDTAEIAGEPAYRLGSFKAFLGQRDHERHERFQAARARIS
jgi:DNA (cytosine-5)-methyltransferase 1